MVHLGPSPFPLPHAEWLQTISAMCKDQEIFTRERIEVRVTNLFLGFS